MSDLAAKKRFLLQSMESIGLPKRVSNSFLNDNVTTVFQALSISRAEMGRMINLGRKGINQFEEIASAHDFKIGDTKGFCDTDLTPQNINEKINFFLQTQDEKDFETVSENIRWILPLLPENLRTGIKSEFLASAIGSEEFKAAIQPHMDAIQQAAITQIHKALGFDKT